MIFNLDFIGCAVAISVVFLAGSSYAFHQNFMTMRSLIKLGMGCRKESKTCLIQQEQEKSSVRQEYSKYDEEEEFLDMFGFGDYTPESNKPLTRKSSKLKLENEDNNLILARSATGLCGSDLGLPERGSMIYVPTYAPHSQANTQTVLLDETPVVRPVLGSMLKEDNGENPVVRPIPEKIAGKPNTLAVLQKECFQGIVEGLVLESISQLFHEKHPTNIDALEEETELLTMKSLMSDLMKGGVIQGRRILPVVAFAILRDPSLLHIFDDTTKDIYSTTNTTSTAGNTARSTAGNAARNTAGNTEGKFRNSMVPISTMKMIGKYIVWPMLIKSIAHTLPVMAIHFSADELKNLFHM